MAKQGTVTLHEATPVQNWRHVRKPEWVDECSRVYDGMALKVAGHVWRQVLVVFDGERTTAYLTANGFDWRAQGHIAYVQRACHQAYGEGGAEVLARRQMGHGRAAVLRCVPHLLQGA